MKTNRFKKVLVPTLYFLGVIGFLVGLFFVEKSFNNQGFKDKDDYDYVSETVFEKEIPVVAEIETIIRPYKDSDVKVVKGFYDYTNDATNQQNSLIYHDGTYIQSTGVSYGGKENFEIVSILSGKVITVKEDKLLGNIIEIKHENGLISVYQSLSEVSVKVNDNVEQGATIGKSGLSNIDTELDSHLYFELIDEGQIVNPESYFNKKTNEI